MSLITPAKLTEALETFLKTFKDKSGKLKYRIRLSQMVSIGSKSLVVDFEDLLMHNLDLANRLRNEPDDIIPSFNDAAYEALRVENPDYAKRIRKDIKVRIRNLTDKLSLRQITTEHLDKLVSVTGMVVRASELKPLALEAAFICNRGHITKIPQSGIVLKKPSKCIEANCKSIKFELDMKSTVFIDYQIIRLQELPEELPPGQLPQAFDVSLQGDIVNTARPGDRVILTGIVRAEAEYSQSAGKLRIFRSKIEGNYVEVLGKEPELIQITKEDEELIHSIASQPGAYERLIESVAPTIHGYETQKEAILLLVTGSPQRVMPDGTTIRGDVNVLLVGDPGTAKSEFLKYAARIAPRGLYTSGRGSTAAGLCVAGDTCIMTEEGIHRIGQLVESELLRGNALVEGGFIAATMPQARRVAAPGEGMKGIGVHKIVNYFRTPPCPSITFHTRLGKSLTVTPETPVLCSREGQVAIWRRASDIKVGEYLAYAHELPEIKAKVQVLISWLPDHYLIHCSPCFLRRLMKELRQRYRTLLKAAEDMTIPEDDLYHNWFSGRMYPKLGELRKILAALNRSEEELSRNIKAIIYRSYRGTERVKLPVYPDKRFMEFLGDVYSNGELLKDSRKKNAYTIGYFNGDKAYVRAFCARVKELFGISATPKKDPRERCHLARFQNRVVADLLQSFGLRPGRKAKIISLPKNIASLRNELLAPFLRQVFTNDGGVVRRKCVQVTTASKDFAEQLQMLLLRFGIVCSMRRRPGKEVKFKDKYIRSGDRYEVSVWDKESLVKYRDLIGFGDVKKARLLEETIKEKKGTHRNYRLKDGFAFLKVVKKEYGHLDRMYDLTINDAQAFVANGFVVHNTAAVVRERTGMMMLEAGAVVLADQGVAAIDEFDKMRTEDRNALHEVMEQQTVSVAKGGIVATLNARTSILAASNPILGKYDPYRNIADNLNLPIPLLTRFDLIFVLRDIPDRAKDEQLARHVLELHRKGEYATAPPIDFNLLRKYIIYAKKIQPTLTKEAEKKILEYYLEMRKIGSEFMITVTPRQLESLIRLATARARIMLRDKITEEDAIRAISLMRRMLETVGVDVKTGKIDLGVLHGRPLSERTLLETALDIFKTLEGPQKNPVEGRAFIEELVKTKKFTQEDAQRMLQTLNRSGQIYEVKPGF
ncbi:MAG: LAGLIDADG family homing endonuclease, partial [Nitrososphaerales archaeon]